MASKNKKKQIIDSTKIFGKVNEELSFSLKCLDFDNYGFDKLDIRTLKKFNQWLRNNTGKTVTEFQLANNQRKDDKSDVDVIDDVQHSIHHYKIDKSFRIHGYIIGNRFKIKRIDPNHEYHD